MKTTVFYYDAYYPGKLITYKEFMRIKQVKLKNRQLKNQGWKPAGMLSISIKL